MTTINAKVTKTECLLQMDGELTSGMVGVPISFEFTPEWKELKKTAVFYAGTVKRDRINIERSTTVPAEVLQKSMENLYVGIYGYREDGTIVIPTVMAKVGMILRGANPSGDPGVDPNLPIWADLERRVSDLEEGCGDAAVKSVNGITPDENGNVEIKLPEGSGSSVTIDPTLTKSGQAADAKAVGDALAELEKKIPEQSGSPELFDKADLPIDPQSFVTVDGVEYYRYHAGPTNFTWNNPHPQTGSVTITARGVSQYGGTGTARLKTVYNDGTFGPDIYIVVGGESRTASVTTDENKTLAKITGNYDLENWVLLDMSVMSVRADYLVQEEYILPVATADNLGGIKADPVESTDTQPVRIGADGKLYTAPGASGGGETPVSGGDLELIATVTTTEEVTVIEIDMDSNGKQFALKDIGINLDRTYTNPGSTGLFIESTGVNGRNYRLAYIPNMLKVTQYIRKFYSDSFVVSMFNSAADSASEVVWTGYICPSNNNISKIKLNLSKTDISFPVGTKIELWGVRA